MQYTGAIDFIYLGKWHPKLNWGQELQADNLCTVTVHEFFLCMLLYILRKSILDCLRQFSLTIFFLFLVYRVVYRSGDKIEVATDSDIRGGAKVPGKMGRKKIQISRIGDERNRQVRMEIKLYIFFSALGRSALLLLRHIAASGFCGCFQY